MDGGCKNPYLFYDGPDQPKLLIVGEAPGREEDEKVRLFIGRAGTLLRGSLTDLGFDVEQEVGFANVCACRPPDNRTPTLKEIKACLPNLVETIKLVAPTIKMVLLMGNTPMQALLGKKGITKYHGIAEYVGTVPYYPVYHPAYVLRNEGTAVVETFFSDLEKAARIYEELDGKAVKTWRVEEVGAKQLEALLPEILKADLLSFDCETTGLDMYSDTADIIGVGLSFSDELGYFVPLYHPEYKLAPAEYVARIEALKLVLGTKTPKVAQNGNFDLRFLKQILGIEVANYRYDTILMSHLLDENTQHDLTFLTNRYNPDMAGYDDVMAGAMREARGQMSQVKYDLIPPYCGGDAITTRRVCKVLIEELKQQGLDELFENIVMPASKAYVKMETAGIKLDSNYATFLQTEYENRIAELEEAIYTLPLCQKWESLKGGRVNLGSPKQMQELLYDKDLGKLPIQYNKKTNNPTTDKDARKALGELVGPPAWSDGLAVVKALEYWSKVKTLHKTFVSKSLSWIRDDGLVHPEFLMYGTVTGRLSTKAPNTQQIPKQTPDDDWLREHPIKRMFVSKWEDGYLVCADYSQLELRLIACISGDSIMLDTYRKDGDLHETTARLMYPDYDLVAPEIRKKYRGEGKTQNFASVYSLADSFLDIYPGVRVFAERTLEECKKRGYVTNQVGRQRRLPAINSFDRKEFYHAYLQACNFKIQSLGHDLLKMALVQVQTALELGGYQSHVVLDIHDAIVVDSPNEEEARQVAVIMKQKMEDVSAMKWAVIPFKVEVSLGRNWQDQEDLVL